jgi:glycosyltransferase involved in cell wall biosynthesis
MSDRFVLLTAAKNEEQYIGHAIRSVIRQTIHPVAWFIVDDGSTDHTGKIIREYSTANPFIQLVNRVSGQERSFGEKDRAINMAYELARNLSFDFIGVQDADIEVAREDYYEQVISAFLRDSRLGIAGGYIFERRGRQWMPRYANSPDAVAGGIQTFRRACFEQIGGYSPLSFGGEDWLAQIEAKRNGWRVAALTNLPVYHYRPTSSADGRLRGLFRLGMMDASFGSHPAFEVLKCVRRFGERPRILSSLVRLSGYLWWNLSRRRPLLSADTVAFLRIQQIEKLFYAIGHGLNRIIPLRR